MSALKMLILSLLISFSSFAQDKGFEVIPSLESCSFQAEVHGQGYRNISPKCFQAISKKKEIALTAESGHGRVTALAYKNMLYIENKTSKRVQSIDKKSSLTMKPRVYTLAGNKTTLHNILSISLDQKSEKVAILNVNKNNQKQILIFPTYRSGNFSPLKVLDLAQISSDPKVIRYDREKEELFILDSKDHKIIIVSAQADSRHHDLSKHPKIIRELSLEGLDHKKLSSFVFYKNSILIGDASSNSIHVIDSSCQGKCLLRDSFTHNIFKSCDLKSIESDGRIFTLANKCGEKTSLSFD